VNDPIRLILSRKVKLNTNLDTYKGEIPVRLEQMKHVLGARLTDALDRFPDGAAVQSTTEFDVEDSVLTIRREITVDDPPSYDGETAIDPHRSDAYNDGVQDAIARKKVTDNPFDLAGSRHGYSDWLKGWQDQMGLIMGVDISVLFCSIPSDQPPAAHTRPYARGFETGYQQLNVHNAPYPYHSYEYVCWKDGYLAGSVKRKDERSLIYRTALVRTMQDDQLPITKNPYPFGTTDYCQWEAGFLRGRSYYASPMFSLHWRTGWLCAFHNRNEGNPYTPGSTGWTRFNIGHRQGKLDRKRVGLD
jgi:hypothetical protein